MSTRRVLLAWELGAGFGHLAELRPFAQHLDQCGIPFAWAVRDLDDASRFLTPTPNLAHKLLQAPISLHGSPQKPAVHLSYASILYASAFYDADILAHRIRAWWALFKHTKATALLASHAPTAVLAARCLGLVCAHIGNGFTVPSMQQPFAAFHPQAQHSTLINNEALVLDIVNRALRQLGMPALDGLQNLFDHTASALLTYPETDHGKASSPREYLGLPELSLGAGVQWRDQAITRIVAYLGPSNDLPKILTALAHARADVVVRMRAQDHTELAAFTRPGLVFTANHLHLGKALASADLFVGYAAHASSVEALLAGKPMLLCPEHREQQLMAQTLCKQGSAIQLQRAEQADYHNALATLMDDRRYQNAAQEFQQRYLAQDRSTIVSRWLTQFLA